MRGILTTLAGVTAGASLIAAGPPAAAETTPQAPIERDQLVQMSDVGAGSLLLESLESGYYVAAPMVATDVQIDAAGPVVRARVTQRFENPSDQWVEGVYVFPLPEDAGVDRLRMMIGDRFIEGEIREREEARRIYEQAREAGRRASLVEQERPNVFTNSVANIGPGETVVVQIEYQGVAHLRDGVWSVRFPMVVGPRFVPPPELFMVASANGNVGLGVSDPAPDRDRITPPVMDPDVEPSDRLRLPVSINATINAGFALGAIESPYHPIHVERPSAGVAEVSLADGEVPANRDFALEWRAADPNAPHAALFHEERDGAHYVLAMITPPAELSANAPRRPREAIFVIDNSGSMAGQSIAQARQALLLALERLEPNDTFNVIRFDDTMELVFTEPVLATEQNVAHAVRFVAALTADGGTQMLPALRASLVDHGGVGDGRVRQVVFLTDGAIGNEAQLFQAIDAGLGRSRLFTVGIGSAPNSYFMTRAARIGRGTFTHIGDVNEVAEEMAALFQALERPVMTDLEALFPRGANAEYWPNPLPDLYFGEPVAVAAKVDSLDGVLRIDGALAGGGWSAELPLSEATDGAGVSTLWARARIAAIEESRFTGAAPSAVDAAVLSTALEYSLVSRLTSLVAVDRTPARPANLDVARRDIATMLPEGWDFEAVFGERVRPFEREALMRDPRYAALAGSDAAETAEEALGPDGLPLPQGGTLANLQMALGLMLVLVGLGVYARARRAAPARR